VSFLCVKLALITFIVGFDSTTTLFISAASHQTLCKYIKKHHFLLYTNVNLLFLIIAGVMVALIATLLAPTNRYALLLLTLSMLTFGSVFAQSDCIGNIVGERMLCVMCCY
jgi:hypothetical protein